MSMKIILNAINNSGVNIVIFTTLPILISVTEKYKEWFATVVK